MKLTQLLLVATVASMLVIAASPLSARADGGANLRLYIKGADVAGIGSGMAYEVVVIGADTGTWKYDYYLLGNNLTGANPIKSSPNTGNISGTSFSATVTMPSVTGTVELLVNISSTSSATPLWQTVIKKIDVVKSINLVCQVKNPTMTDMNSIPYHVYVDGVMTDNSTLETLAAGSTVNVSSEWYVKDPAEGAHEAVYKFDVDGDGVFGSNGDLVVSFTFYTKAQSTNIALVMTVVGALAALGIGLILIKRKSFK
ncbi:MAG: CARDB domain-containing protein [Methanobacteriota archaeon]